MSKAEPRAPFSKIKMQIPPQLRAEAMLTTCTVTFATMNLRVFHVGTTVAVKSGECSNEAIFLKLGRPFYDR